MKFHSRVLAGTALGLLMAASAAGAANLHPVTAANNDNAAQAPLLMAQADSENPIEKKARKAEKRAEKAAQQEEKRAQPQEKPAAKAEKPKRSGQSEERAQKADGRAAQAPANDEAPAMKPNRKDRHAEKAAGPDAGSGDQPMKPERDRKQRQQSKEPAHGQPQNTQAPETKHQKKSREVSGEGQAEKAQSRQQPEANPQAPETKPQKKDRGAEGKQNAPAGEKRAEKPQTGKQPAEAGKSQPDAKSQTPAETTRPVEGGVTNEAQSPEKKGEKNRRRPGQAVSPDQNAGSGQDTGSSQDTGNEAGGHSGEMAPKKAGQPELPGNAGTRQRGEKPAMEGQNGKDQNGKDRNGRPQTNEAANPLPENAAPVFDSNKRNHRRDNDKAGGNGRNDHRGGDRNGRNAQNGNQPPVNAGPPPKSDAAAQDFRRGGKFEVQSVDEVKGKRIEGDRRPRWQRRKDADVVKEIGSRVIINLGGQTIVQSTEHDRLGRHARDIYYEDLPHNRVRETIERPDGSRVVTIRNQYGDVIRRSRFTRDDREIVLVYVDDRDLERDRDGGWRDPGEDLPPMHLTIPVSQYILNSDNVRDPDRYYEFLDQPPVEKVERLYTLGDVRRSARVRDMMPRVDLDTINFDTGSAEISQGQVDDLQGVADAMKRIIDQNPGETFLIEGHTDAVGDPNSNLALSDERAESVADVLTNDFKIPPENLVTQGYGEEYLKVDTDGANRDNRRVAIRRITPLVAPVASAQ
ncbi:MAG: OmpA family protein [Hyphomicrobiales bacterium]|nr:OmpA family protein [Hyphomicrobiales bacterium]